MPSTDWKASVGQRSSPGVGPMASSARTVESLAQPHRHPRQVPVFGLPHADFADCGAIFAATKAPLTTWFRAMYHLTQSKHGISSIELGRRLGVTQTTAWKMKTKLAEVMRRSSDRDRLHGRIEMDDAYLGGERSGGKTGRGSPGKTPIIAAVETTDDGKPKRLKIRRMPGSSASA